MKFYSNLIELEKRARRNVRLGVRAHPTVFVADSASLSGRVVMGKNVSVWYGAVLRGDIESVFVGDETNIQDGAVLHVADRLPCRIGKRCTIGHKAIVHACTIQDECLIGMGSIVLDRCVVGKGSLVGAGSLVLQGMKIPPNSLVFGTPAQVIRPLTSSERRDLRHAAQRYVRLARIHLKRG